MMTMTAVPMPATRSTGLATGLATIVDRRETQQVFATAAPCPW